MKGYPDRIRDAIAATEWKDADPRVVECFMRLQYGTLDHLGRETFRAEAILGAQITIEHPDAAKSLAQSYGITV